ncbi:MAG: hypothetical protein Q9168_001496 [Polycauliona sp. 1 TL-2023]
MAAAKAEKRDPAATAKEVATQVRQRAERNSRLWAAYEEGSSDQKRTEQFIKFEKKYERLNSYSDDAVKSFREFINNGQQPATLSKLSGDEAQTFVNSPEAYTDIRKSIVWAYLGGEHGSKGNWLGVIGDEERYWRSMVVQKMHKGADMLLFNHLLNFGSATKDEENLSPSSRNSQNFF